MVRLMLKKKNNRRLFQLLVPFFSLVRRQKFSLNISLPVFCPDVSMRKAFGQENQYLNLSKQSVYHPGKLNVISRAFGEFLVSIAEKKKKLSFCTKLLSLALDVKTSMLSSLSFLAHLHSLLRQARQRRKRLGSSCWRQSFYTDDVALHRSRWRLWLVVAQF